MSELTLDINSGSAEPSPQSAGLPHEPAPRTSSFRQLEDVIQDESFPEVDLALRRGRHIHKGDERWYEFLVDAQALLEPFYVRYGCELTQRSDGYFFLLPVTDSLGKRHLGVPEMIVGQGLALCYLDPRSVQSGGVVTREEVLNQLASVMGTDALMRTLNPKRKRVDERVMQRTVRQKVNEALRRLGQLGFVELLDGEQLRLAPSLMRFAEPVRGLDAPSEALKRLIERGEVSLGPGDADSEYATADEESGDDGGDADDDGPGADDDGPGADDDSGASGPPAPFDDVLPLGALGADAAEDGALGELNTSSAVAYAPLEDNFDLDTDAAGGDFGPSEVEPQQEASDPGPESPGDWEPDPDDADAERAAPRSAESIDLDWDELPGEKA